MKGALSQLILIEISLWEHLLEAFSQREAGVGHYDVFRANLICC